MNNIYYKPEALSYKSNLDKMTMAIRTYSWFAIQALEKVQMGNAKLLASCGFSCIDGEWVHLERMREEVMEGETK